MSVDQMVFGQKALSQLWQPIHVESQPNLTDIYYLKIAITFSMKMLN